MQTPENVAQEGLIPQSLISDFKLMPQSYFKNIQITPINGSNTIILGGSQQQTQFEIPISCWNPYWTTICFNVQCASNIVAGQQLIIPNNYWPFWNRVELYTSSGNVYLLNIQQCDVYSRLSNQLNLNARERGKELGTIINSSRNIFGDRSVGNADYSASVDLPANTTTGNVDLLPVLDFNSIGMGTYAAYGLEAPNSNTLGQSTVLAYRGAADNAPYVQSLTYNVRLGDIIPDSIFNMNNSFYLSKVLYLRITWNPVNLICYKYNFNVAEYQQLPLAPVIIQKGVHALTVGVVNDQAPVNQINLQIRIEGDEGVINQKKLLTQQPSTIVVPYIYNWSQAQTGGGLNQTSFTLASDGSKIF